MKNIISALIAFCLMGCKNSDNNLLQKEDLRIVEKKALPFFGFDQVDYYHIDITKNEWIKIIKKRDKQNSDEKKLLNILNNHLPENSLHDGQFIADVNKLYPIRREIDQSKFGILSNIYSEKFIGDYALAACEPFYRDILVFKKQNETVGISKICFDCYLHSTVGTKRDTEQLGQNGDYEKLKTILK